MKVKVKVCVVLGLTFISSPWKFLIVFLLCIIDGKDDDDEKEKTDDEKVEVEDDIEEEIDEEMDEGTDYASNYFDNGEGYLDEDDNLDEGEAQF